MWACWNTDSLFLCAEPEDDSVVVRTRDTGFWLDGDIEFLLEIGNRKSSLPDSGTFHRTANPHGTVRMTRLYVEGARGGATFAPAGHAKPLPTGYRLVCAIPWRILAVTPRPGLRIGFDATAFDCDREGGISVLGTWAGLHLGNHHNPSEFGTLVLSGAGPARKALVTSFTRPRPRRAWSIPIPYPCTTWVSLGQAVSAYYYSLADLLAPSRRR